MSTIRLMLDILPCIPLFEDLDFDQINLVKPLFEQVVFPSGETIIRQGDPAVFLYLIVNGNAEIHYKPYDGPPLTLTRLHAGDIFGWSAVVGSHYYTSSIVSETEMEVIRIKGKELMTTAKLYPETGKLILDRLVRSVLPRWHNANEQVEAVLNSL